MQSITNDETSKNSEEEIFLKINKIEINKQLNTFDNYTQKISNKFPILKDYIINSNTKTKNKTENNLIKDKARLNKQKIAIIYHYPCFDGSYSAVNSFIYYKYISNKINTINFFPMTNSHRLDDILEQEMLQEYNKIYIFDKGFNQQDYEFLYETLNNNYFEENKIVIIDHHISSIKKFFEKFSDKFNCFNNIAFIFDKEEKRSACGISYDYFDIKALRKLKSLLDLKSKKFEEIFQNYKKHFSYEYKKVSRFKLLFIKLLNLILQNSLNYLFLKLICYIEDTDIGNFLLEYTNEFKSGLNN